MSDDLQQEEPEAVAGALMTPATDAPLEEPVPVEGDEPEPEATEDERVAAVAAMVENENAAAPSEDEVARLYVHEPGEAPTPRGATDVPGEHDAIAAADTTDDPQPSETT